MMELFDRLAEPFDPDRVHWRIGSTNADKTKAMALAYIDARDVMDRFDLVCGPSGWERRHPYGNGKTNICEVAVWVEGRGWVVKADGAGDTDVEGEKGGCSDSFKRAAVNWGVGRYLYGLPSPWVEIEPAGRSFKIKKGEYPKLRQLLSTYTGVKPKAAAQMKRDQDFEFFQKKLAEARDLEELGAVGREIKQALPSLPVSVRDPLEDAYLARREELREAASDAAYQQSADRPPAYAS